MEQPISRSEKKRQAKNIEELARELAELSSASIKVLPCDDFLKKEIDYAKQLKGGAKKRQIKYITKNLRDLDPGPLFDFLAERQGSKLKEVKKFHELEYLRDEIIAEAFEALRKLERYDKNLDSGWHSTKIEAAISKYPTIDRNDIKLAAIKFAKTQKPNFKREIFRMLNAAHEHQQFLNKK